MVQPINFRCSGFQKKLKPYPEEKHNNVFLYFQKTLQLHMQNAEHCSQKDVYHLSLNKTEYSFSLAKSDGILLITTRAPSFNGSCKYFLKPLNKSSKRRYWIQASTNLCCRVIQNLRDLSEIPCTYLEFIKQY